MRAAIIDAARRVACLRRAAAPRATLDIFGAITPACCARRACSPSRYVMPLQVAIAFYAPCFIATMYDFRAAADTPPPLAPTLPARVDFRAAA